MLVHEPMVQTTRPSIPVAQFTMLVGHGSLLGADIMRGGGGLTVTLV